MEKVKSPEELQDELCKWCPRDENTKGAFSTGGGIAIGCEGNNCKEAYEIYLDELKSNCEEIATMSLPTIKDILDEIKEDEKSGMYCLTREDAVKKAWWIMHDAIEKEVKDE